MATRANIVVKKDSGEHYIYHHFDGYLEGVGKDLEDFISSKYKPNIWTISEFCEQLNDWDSSFEIDCGGIHGDIEYLYYININSEEKLINLTASSVSYDRNDDWAQIMEPIAGYNKEFKL